MSPYMAILNDSIVVAIVLLVGWVALASQGGIFQYATHALRLQGRAALASSMWRMLWISRLFLAVVTSIYLWEAFCWVYPPIRSILPANSTPPKIFEVAWGVLLAAGVVHVVLIVPMSSLVPKAHGNLLRTLSVSLCYDGFPQFMERWPGFIKLVLIGIMVISIVPFAVYLAYAVPTGFARWHGYVVPNRTRMQ